MATIGTHNVDAFQMLHGGDRTIYRWHTGQAVDPASFEGIVRVYDYCQPAIDMRTWLEGGERHWQAA